MSELNELSLVEAADAVRAGRVSSVELTEACIARIEAVQPTINAFISFEPEAALAEARQRDSEAASGNYRGSLHGVPMAHKDLLYRDGKVVTCGSKVLGDFVADTTATVLVRLEAAGAINLGTLGMAELALGASGRNEHFGHCRNPWNPDHITGGSSSGSGALVAARGAFAAIGTDTGGSVRLPSAICGITGLKPTQTRVSRHGIMPLSYSLDNAGPMARTAADCARMMDVIAGYDDNDPTSSTEPVADYEYGLENAEIKGIRIGVPTSHYYDHATDDVKAALSESLDVLKGLGAEIIEVDMPDHTIYRDLLGVILRGEAGSIHARWFAERPEDYSTEVRARIEAGLYLPAVRYVEAQRLRPVLLKEFLDTVMDKIDVLHAPVMASAVPTLEETDSGVSDDALLVNEQLAYCTRAASFLGLPSLSVPCGFADRGLPVAFQLMGRGFQEATLLKIGHAYQGATDWHTRMPAL
jgi:aspartyl-tRNA(Asn)/glutamyl-tRNA(Gln) amidotransferase subunit A